MDIQIKSGDISNETELEELKAIIYSRFSDANMFKICLKQASRVDLSLFNSLVSIHMTLKRMNKLVLFENCECENLKNLISKTQFHHVFIK